MSGDMQRSHALVTLALDNPRGTLDTLRDAELMMLGDGVNKPRLTALIEQIKAQVPTKPEVFEHLAVETISGMLALCGKVWRRNDPDAVTVVSKCPDCTAMVERSWTA